MGKNRVKTKLCCSCPIKEAEKPLRDFYSSTNPLHSDGLVPMCKDCIKKLCYNEQNNTIDVSKFKDILRQIDRPFIKIMWDAAIKQYKTLLKTKPNCNCQAIIGFYMKNIGMKQCKNTTWQDGVAAEQNEHDLQDKTKTKKRVDNENENKSSEQLIWSDVWRGKFTRSEIDYLNNYYEGLNKDYKIITQNHRDYAKKIAKASLQMDKCYEDMIMGVKDADTRYKNAREAFDSLCKSAKFSESTRIKNVGLTAFSVIAEKVEEHNWIYEHKPSKEEKDEIDNLLDVICETLRKSI